MSSPGVALLRRLREADALLGTVAPSPDLEARIRARVTAEKRRTPLLISLGLDARKLRRPLILAFALALALLVVSTRRTPAEAPPVASSGPDQASEPIVDDRDRSDAGPEERSGQRRRPPPLLHFPAVEPLPRVFDPEAPPSARPPTETPPAPPGPWGRADDGEDLPLHSSPARLPSPGDRPGSRSSSALPPAPSAVLAPAAAPRTVYAPPSRPADEPSLSSRPSAPAASSDTCKSGVLGFGLCVDYSVFKLQASGLICPTGLSLTDFQIDPGSCDETQALAAHFTCCPAPPPGPPVTKDPGGPSPCVAQSFSAVCQDPAALESQAKEACSAAGMTYTPMKLGGACADGLASDVAFYCCPVPSSSGCADQSIGGGACQDLVALKQKLEGDLCPAGKTATNVAFETGGCPDGQALDVKITCCTSQ